ncbi:hypothetical protein GXP67_26635 [Rhodocytophaga rosea]|uniref:Uncharacterized protein n=1 Tax=Rhodocytophaga rosea TaxID=2704465 RepID=A0A6C0GPX1_9BACT|nr:hypothetical protein [Rhodocytophaga rosea]QHT69967.1 hypothetical protein GXP67_26635 [Rhodocytophaga rosea]
MEIIITIFKQQLEDTPSLKTELTHLSLQVREISVAFLFLPKEENVATFIELLNTHRISFGVHVLGEEIPDIIRGGGQSNAGG